MPKWMWVFWLICLACPRCPAATVGDSQSFAIQPGWNAIYLEVSPTTPSPQTVFGGLGGVQQVWSFLAPRSSVQYINDPSAGLWNVPGWKVWLPADPQHPENAALTNMTAVIGHQTYLIKYGGTTPATLTVSGLSGFRPVTWNPDAFTLTGLPVDPSATVLAGDYFASDASHQGQGRYYLAPSGVWLPLADTAALKRGQAYWFYTKGGSNYQAAMDVNFGGGESLDYGSSANARVWTFTNRASQPVQVTVAAPAGIPLAYESTDATTHRPVWLPLANYTTTVAPGAKASLNIGVLRSQIGTDKDLGALCSVSLQAVAVNGSAAKFNTVLKVPVTVQSKNVAGVANPMSLARRVAANTPVSANPDAGLWVGSVTLNAVDEVNSTVGQIVNNSPVSLAE